MDPTPDICRTWRRSGRCGLVPRARRLPPVASPDLRTNNSRIPWSVEAYGVGDEGMPSGALAGCFPVEAEPPNPSKQIRGDTAGSTSLRRAAPSHAIASAGPSRRRPDAATVPHPVRCRRNRTRGERSRLAASRGRRAISSKHCFTTTNRNRASSGTRNGLCVFWSISIPRYRFRPSDLVSTGLISVVSGSFSSRTPPVFEVFAETKFK